MTICHWKTIQALNERPHQQTVIIGRGRHRDILELADMEVKLFIKYAPMPVKAQIGIDYYESTSKVRLLRC